MKRVLLFFLTVSSLYTIPSWAKTFVVAPSTPVLVRHAVVQPVTLRINNRLGNVQLTEGQGSEFRMEGMNLGDRSVFLNLDDSDPSQLDISVDYPRFSDQSNIKSLHLQIEAPKDFLKHLKVESQLGNIRIDSAFSNMVSNERKVLLTSDSGNMSVTHLMAGAGFQIKGKTGEIRLKSLRLRSAKLENFEGDIFLEDILSKILSVYTAQGSVSSEAGKGEIQITTRSGTIHVRGHENGSVVARSETGDIFLDNPNLATLEQASSASGLVRSLHVDTQAICEPKFTD